MDTVKISSLVTPLMIAILIGFFASLWTEQKKTNEMLSLINTTIALHEYRLSKLEAIRAERVHP